MSTGTDLGTAQGVIQFYVYNNELDYIKSDNMLYKETAQIRALLHVERNVAGGAWKLRQARIFR